MSPKKKPKPNIVERRPAETATPVAMAVAMLLARVTGVDDPNTIAYVAIVVGFVPAGITWLVTTVRG